MMRREQVHMLVDALLDLGQSALRRQMPAEASDHFASARREALLGLRALVDGALARQEQEAAAASRPTSIPVEE